MSAAKIVATMFVVAMMFVVIAITAIIVQIANEYYRLEIPLYFTGLFVNFGWSIFLLCVFAVFIQSVVPNKWLGMLAFLGLFLLFSVLSSFGFEHVLYQVAAPTAPYSDINGYGHFLERQFTVGAYWSAFCLLLAVVAHLFMRRGVTDGWRERIVDARQRFTPNVRALTAVAAVLWISRRLDLLQHECLERIPDKRRPRRTSGGLRKIVQAIRGHDATRSDRRRDASRYLPRRATTRESGNDGDGEPHR